jgi:multicomponent K+:H+ antiporter subunit D
VGVVELSPIALLLLLCVGQTVQAGPIMRFMQATAESLHARENYINGVLADPAPERQAPEAGRR